jgi:regulatory protein
MAMAARYPRKPRPPLDAAKLGDLALAYVGRFATSRAKLLSYLKRKLRERGWGGSGEPDLQSLANRLVELGYVDDRAFAVAKARSLTSRGYGERRVGQALMLAGMNAALRFARRRSIGPFAKAAPDPREREKAIAAMVRAGHRFGLSRAIVSLEPGSEADVESLAESC